MLSNRSFNHFPDDIITLSRSIISRLYTGMPADILPWLHNDIIWTDTASSRYFYGYYQVVNFLLHYPDVQERVVRHLQYHSRNLENGTCVITGKYKVMQKEADRSGTCMSYQISLIWTSSHDCPRLVHLHISVAAPQAPYAEFLSFHGKKAETYRVLPEEILYIEAENVNCTIHTTAALLSVCQPISQMEKLLPRQFLRVHRSFIINRHYVSRVYRYAIELSNRAVVPVPEKKYMNVVCAIERQDF